MLASSFPGPKYVKKGWTCQDSSSCLSYGRVQAVAVADGHGSPDCFRSEHGARIAVEAAFRQVKRYCREEAFDTDQPALLSRVGIDNLKFDILRDWEQSVREHWDRYLDIHSCPGEDEIRFQAVSEKYRQRYLSDDPAVVDKYLYTAYGTTLLLAVSIGTQILLLQIGDGTCVLLQRDGTFSVPLPPDRDNYLNVTVSLCDEDAMHHYRYAVIPCDPASQTEPAAVFLSTDGVDDCFPVYQNENYLYKLYSLIIESILDRGFQATVEDIKQDLLQSMTERGSRDDISLACLISQDQELLQNAFDRIDPECCLPGKKEDRGDTDTEIFTDSENELRTDTESLNSKETGKEEEDNTDDNHEQSGTV